MKRVGIYLRVSTDSQTTNRELEAVAKRSGWVVVGVYEDADISGAKGRDKRPGVLGFPGICPSGGKCIGGASSLRQLEARQYGR
jgi:hypothetical protein